MILFSFLWVFLFYLFWKALVPEGGGVWALAFGTLAALLQLPAGPLVFPGAFGMMRWLSGFVDLIVFPIVLPLGLCLLLLVFRVFPASLSLSKFLLLWLIPVSVFRALGANASSPLESVFIPLLWTALAVGMPFFIGLFQELSGALALLAIAACVVLPFLGAAAYWAFFCQKPFLAYALSALSFLPMLSTATVYVLRAAKRG
jgi:hypothetical protein